MSASSSDGAAGKGGRGSLAVKAANLASIRASSASVLASLAVARPKARARLGCTRRTGEPRSAARRISGRS